MIMLKIVLCGKYIWTAKEIYMHENGIKGYELCLWFFAAAATSSFVGFLLA